MGGVVRAAQAPRFGEAERRQSGEAARVFCGAKYCVRHAPPIEESARVRREALSLGWRRFGKVGDVAVKLKAAERAAPAAFSNLDLFPTFADAAAVMSCSAAAALRARISSLRSTLRALRATIPNDSKNPACKSGISSYFGDADGVAVIFDNADEIVGFQPNCCGVFVRVNSYYLRWFGKILVQIECDLAFVIV